MIQSKCIVKHTLQYAICTTSLELFVVYSKDKTKSFMPKLLFIKVRCLINVKKNWVSLEMDEEQKCG